MLTPVIYVSSLGWGGAGLGKSQQGIHNPISGGDVRDKFDKFKVCTRDMRFFFL